MRDPKILLGRLWVIFDVICFCLALYMTIRMIGRLREDRSATLISYRRYGDTIEHKYPDFSVCVKDDHLYRYNGSAIFKAYKINPTEYKMLLEGKPAYRFKYDATSRLYDKIPLPPTHETNFTFDQMAKDSYELSDIVKGAEFQTKDARSSIVYRKRKRIGLQKTVDEPPFFISYRSSKFLCFTRKSMMVEWYNSMAIRNKDYLYLDLSFLDSTTEVDILIHYPGQLMRYLDSPILALDSLEMKGNKYKVKITHSTVLQKRFTKHEPCVENDDYDLYLQEAVINKIKCIPPFWMYKRKSNSHIKECTSIEMLKEINGVIVDIYKENFDYSSSVLKRLEIDPPCLDMFNSIVWSSNSSRKLDVNSALIKISYLEKYYEEIRQVEDFGALDFVSNVGGFIGLFLGYSILQIPELLGM